MTTDPWEAPVERPVDQEETFRNESAWLLRCRKAGCRKAHKVTATTETVHGARNGFPFSRTSFVRPDGLLRPIRDAIDMRNQVLALLPSCTGCGGHALEAARVDGRYHPGKKCGPRCTGAVGPVCECVCGGERHGDSWR